MKKYFLDLFEYNNWANDKIIFKLKNVNHNFDGLDPQKIFSHIIAAQDTWLERVKGTKSYNIFLWDEYSIQELEVLSINSHKGWNKFITRMNDKKLEKLCIYKNSKGEEISRSYQDIFQHVINHSTYHHGQINQLLRMNNIEPVIIDFIYCC